MDIYGKGFKVNPWTRKNSSLFFIFVKIFLDFLHFIVYNCIITN
nr:MAG TPA: hypothetical protein [Caudoviricetes sp.]